MNSSSYSPTIQAVHQSPRSVPHFKRLATEGKPWRRRSLQIVARRCCRGLGLAVLDVAATRCRRAQRCHRQISLISTHRRRIWGRRRCLPHLRCYSTTAFALDLRRAPPFILVLAGVHRKRCASTSPIHLHSPAPAHLPLLPHRGAPSVQRDGHDALGGSNTAPRQCTLPASFFFLTGTPLFILTGVHRWSRSSSSTAHRRYNMMATTPRADLGPSLVGVHRSSSSLPVYIVGVVLLPHQYTFVHLLPRAPPSSSPPRYTAPKPACASATCFIVLLMYGVL